MNLSSLRKIQAKQVHFDISLLLYADVVFFLKINECSEESEEGLKRVCKKGSLLFVIFFCCPKLFKALFHEMIILPQWKAEWLARAQGGC